MISNKLRNKSRQNFQINFCLDLFLSLFEIIDVWLTARSTHQREALDGAQFVLVGAEGGHGLLVPPDEVVHLPNAAPHLPP